MEVEVLIIVLLLLLEEAEGPKPRIRQRFDYNWCDWDLDSWSATNFEALVRYVSILKVLLLK
jgi:hypothetical protein